MSKNGRRVPPKARRRDKGCDFTSGERINSDSPPLGIAHPGRAAADVPVTIFDVRSEGVPHKPFAKRLAQALELNARTIKIYVDETRHEALNPDLHVALERLTDLDDGVYSDAVESMTNFRSTDMHRESIAKTVRRVVRERRYIRALRYAFTVRKTLLKAKRDAELRHAEESRFAHDNVKKNQKPSNAVLLRTVLPTALKDRDERGASKIKKALANGDALRESSDVSYGDLVNIAYYSLISPEWIYSDFILFQDLFDLAVFAGREALGFREMMDKSQLETYRSMLCGGEDLHPVVEARPARAQVAAMVRTYWRASPDLCRWSRYQGRMLEP